MSSKLIPNSFQYPNFYIDKLSYFLTPQENVVLNKAIREILGWRSKIEKRQARIALSIFEDGKFNRETGERLCYGCGLGVSAIRKALKALNEFGILVKVDDPCPIGQLFRLQDDATQIRMSALKLRRDKWDAEREQRTAKARKVLSDNRGIVGQQDGVLSDNTTGVLSDNTKETHEKPNRNPHGVRTPTAISTEQDKTAIEPPATVDGEATLNEALGNRTRPKAPPVTSNGNWQAHLQDNPHLQWGSESQELQRQVKRYGVASQPVLRLGYELEQALGIRPPWSNRQKVKQWTAGLVSCLEEAEGDWEIVVSTAQKMRTSGLTIKTPHSIAGMVGSAMAEGRTATVSTLQSAFDRDLARSRKRMLDDPQYQTFHAQAVAESEATATGQ